MNEQIGFMICGFLMALVMLINMYGEKVRNWYLNKKNTSYKILF